MEDRATRTVERCQVSRTRGVVHRRKYDRYSRQSRTVDILSKHATETTQNIKNLRGDGRKRKRTSSHNHKAKGVKIAKRKSFKRKAPPKTIKRDILVIRVSHYPIMSGEVEFVSSEFDIFAPKTVRSAILGTNVVHCKLIATVDQNDLEFLIPGDSETYIDQDIKLYVRGNIIGADGKDLDASDFTAGNKNFLNSLFNECSISLNGVNITPASELYPYR